MKISIGEVARILGLSVSPSAEGETVSNLLTDSRSLSQPDGTMFFAIPTRTNDGTRYMRQLYDAGVRYFVAPTVPADMADATDALILLYPSPVEALQRIAARRGDLGGEVVAITGSLGKTTLKEWLFQLMEPLRETARSPRSYNSQIGVPLSMWEISSDTELTLIEAGVSRSGEMARLAECIHPDTVIITDMSDEHSEGFASFEDKVREKVGLAGVPGVKRVIYCADDADVASAVASLPEGVERVAWSLSGDTPLRITSTESTDGQSRIFYSWRGEKGEIAVRVSSHADLRNACHALAFMLSEGFDAATVASRFLCIHPIATRLSVSDGGNGCNVVYDSYTSDFSSLVPAVDFMMRRKVPGQDSVVILSDLRHEARGETDDYTRIANLMKRRGVGLFIGVGENLKGHAASFAPGSLFFNDTRSLVKYLRTSPISDAVILLKGAPEFEFTKVKEALEVRTHATVLEVNLDAMIKNYNYFKSHLPASTGMIAMVKASGYGAGSYEIAKTLQDAGAAYLAVAVLDEGLDLRRQGITMPIMVMNPRVADYREMFAHRLEPEIYTSAMLEDVISQAERYGVTDFPIHVKLDTGMHRMGFIESELPALMERIGGQNRVRISSVFSHLATADMPDMNDYTEMQLATFHRCSEYMLSVCAYKFRRHVLNSAGILRYPQYHYDMARLGIGLYGVNTLPPDMEAPLAPVSSLKTVIINLRHWKAGTTIGYARRGLLKRDSVVATIPIGYADGMNRHFGNGVVKVLVNGKEAPTVGNICMDACMIDVTGIECREGDTVEIFGGSAPVSRLSDVLDTIPYEILTSVSPRVKRVYYRE